MPLAADSAAVLQPSKRLDAPLVLVGAQPAARFSSDDRPASLAIDRLSLDASPPANPLQHVIIPGSPPHKELMSVRSPAACLCRMSSRASHGCGKAPVLACPAVAAVDGGSKSATVSVAYPRSRVRQPQAFQLSCVCGRPTRICLPNLLVARAVNWKQFCNDPA